jgi:PAS domain S-box-containing protein
LTSSPARPWHRHLGLALGVAVIYWGLGTLGYLFVIRPSGVALWPAGGFLLGALLLLDREWWPAALIGGVLGNFVVDRQHGLSVPFALTADLANAVEPLVAATLLRWALPRPISVGTLKEVGWLVLGAAAFSNALTALGGAAALSAWGHRDFWNAWLVWWIGDGMGMLVLTPVVLSVAALIREREPIRGRTVLEGVAVLAAVGVIAALVLRREPGSPRPLGGYPYLAFPALLWAAVRFGPPGAALSTLVLGCVSVWNAAHPRGAMAAAGRSPISEALEIYSFLGLAAVSSLMPASILNQRRRDQRELEESERRFRQMAETIQEAFFVVDLETTVPLYVSPTWAEIWGRPIEDAADPDIWSQAVHPDDRATVVESRRRVARGETNISTFRVVRPDGAVRWIRDRAFPVRSEEGRVYRMVGVSEDITELRQIELQLAHSQRMESVGRLAGGVAHDFNNLLTVILAETDLLLDEPTVDPGTENALRDIRGAAERATMLTRQLLAFSRRQVVEPVVFDLNHLVRDLTALLRRIIGEDVGLVVRPCPETARVRADRGQIEQVVINLAINARDAMPEGGTLTISIGIAALEPAYARSHPEVEPGPYVVLAVTDTGSGMSEHVQTRIFEPFFTTKEGGKGTGLGLSTSYGIATQAGGQLTVSSEPDIGSTFRLYLPHVDPISPTPSTGPAVTTPSGNETILLVEDEAAVRAVATRMLRSQGYVVLEAGDAETAKEVLAAYPGPVHLLLTDVVLPGQHGRELADEVRELRPGIRVLFTSGYTDDAILRLQLIAHGIELLQKPYTRDDLTRKVRTALD